MTDGVSASITDSLSRIAVALEKQNEQSQVQAIGPVFAVAEDMILKEVLKDKTRKLYLTTLGEALALLRRAGHVTTYEVSLNYTPTKFLRALQGTLVQTRACLEFFENDSKPVGPSEERRCHDTAGHITAWLREAGLWS